jgi:cysteine desulfurase
MVNTYLDYNATAPVWPDVIEGVTEAMKVCGNASSVHELGRKVSSLVEEAREKIASLVNAHPSQVIFTSGGTEANNLALSQGRGGCVILASIEHDSILKAHARAKLINVGSDGIICIDHMQSLLAESSAGSIISVMLANNETGVLQPIEHVSAMGRERGALVHCDVIQAVGKIDVNWETLDVDMMSLSAHKLGGPQGIGALIVDEELDFLPCLKGGGQERNRRAGTENVPGIVGFGIAADLVRENKTQMDNTVQLRETMENKLRSIIPEINIHGSSVERLPNTSCFSMPGVEAITQLVALDLDGVMVSAGSACSSGKVTTSHVLKAMGLSNSEASSAIRVSLGWGSKLEDVDAFLSTWQNLYISTRVDDQIKATAA